MPNDTIDYGFWSHFDEWSVLDAWNIMVTYNQDLLEGSNQDNQLELLNSYKRKFSKDVESFAYDIKWDAVYDDNGEQDFDDEGQYLEAVNFKFSKANIIDFIKWAYRERIPLPQEIMDIVKRKSGIAPTMSEAVSTTPNKKDIKVLADLPLLKKQVAELSAEKDKWDASIEAAAKIGLLFYENKLPKPITKDLFIAEFTEQLGKGLPDSTIEKIYKLLPTNYKLKGGRPKKTTGSDNSSANFDNAAIKAAVYAGSIYEESEAKNLAKLKKTLFDAEYEVPSDEILNKIIAAVKEV